MFIFKVFLSYLYVLKWEKRGEYNYSLTNTICKDNDDKIKKN